MEKDMDNGNGRGRDIGAYMDNDPYYGCRCKIQCDGVLRHIDKLEKLTDQRVETANRSILK